MLTLKIESGEFFDEEREVFVAPVQGTLRLEHSLLSLSKWESKWEKPFLTKDQKSEEETLDYIRCMTVGRADERLYEYLGADAVTAVQLYINKPMTATTFQGDRRDGSSNEIVTSELIYYWMVAAGIPFECERWHLNRLFTLIRIAGIKANPDNKRSAADVANEYRRINEARRKAMNTRG